MNFRSHCEEVATRCLATDEAISTFKSQRDCFAALAMTAAFVLTSSQNLDAAKSRPVVNDLPVPFNVQAVVINKTITLSWQWQSPESLPTLRDFGYEILRNDGGTSVVTATTFSDFDLSFGTYSYRVRARAFAKRQGKKTLLVSDWSEPVQATLRVVCQHPPRVTLRVEPTQRSYSQIPALRIHLSGVVQIPEGCSLTRFTYHLETGTGINHSGPLTVDSRGRFDDFVEAVRPEDELPTGGAEFTVTVIAEDEAGPVTSNAYTVHMEMQNRFAPR